MCPNFSIDLDNVNKYIKGNGPIVVVDDDDVQLLLVQTCYKKSKRFNELICLTSGEDFLEYISRVNTNSEQTPELVLLDINMPKTDGFEVLEKVRSMESFKDIPIIMMLTTSDSDSDREKSYALKANAYFSKPENAKSYINFFQNI